MRRIARELGIDLTKFTGTGEKGRITKDDVKRQIARSEPSGRQAQTGIPEIPAQDFAKYGPVETKPMSRLKKLAGPNLHRSWLNMPHVTNSDEADITDLEDYRKDLDENAKAKGYRVTLVAFLLKSAVSALKEYPDVNSSFAPTKDALILKRYYNIGVAVDTPEGLVVPVIRDVDRKGILELEPGTDERLGTHARRQDYADGYPGRHVLDIEPWRHRRHDFHADRQRAGGRDPRSHALKDEAGLGRRRFSAAADAAALPFLRSSRRRWCSRGALPPKSL